VLKNILRWCLGSSTLGDDVYQHVGSIFLQAGAIVKPPSASPIAQNGGGRDSQGRPCA
jgi:hypothetical protein